MFVLFLICMGLQYNDPDPQIWVPLYAVPAFFSLMYFIGKRYLWLTLTAFVIYVIAAIYWCPPLSSLKGNTFDNEEVRESVGLLLSGIWMGVLSLASRVPHPARKTG
jgi:Transmembrane family 220, helix